MSTTRTAFDAAAVEQRMDVHVTGRQVAATLIDGLVLGALVRLVTGA